MMLMMVMMSMMMMVIMITMKMGMVVVVVAVTMMMMMMMMTRTMTTIPMVTMMIRMMVTMTIEWLGEWNGERKNKGKAKRYPEGGLRRPQGRHCHAESQACVERLLLKALRAPGLLARGDRSPPGTSEFRTPIRSGRLFAKSILQT